MDAERVVIIGGGAIGCSIAWRLAQRGRRVTVLEKLEPISKATWAAAGMLLPMIESGSPLVPLAELSFAEYPSFVTELIAASGIDPELQLEDERSGSIDNRKLGRGLYQAAARSGVEFRLFSEARTVHCDDGQFRSVELADGRRVEGDVVVVAAGAWSGELLGLPLRLPLIPVRGQMLAVELERQLVPHIIEGERCYLVPRGEHRLLIGATVEHVGFDERTTRKGLAQLYEAAVQLVPALTQAEVVEAWAGLRPGTPDDLPILGADPRVHGVFYATGHYRNGILLTPITARLLSEVIVDGKASCDLTPFAVDRFTAQSDEPRCDLCGAPMQERHCRIVCTSCGYERDCSDP